MLSSHHKLKRFALRELSGKYGLRVEWRPNSEGNGAAIDENFRGNAGHAWSGYGLGVFDPPSFRFGFPIEGFETLFPNSNIALNMMIKKC